MKTAAFFVLQLLLAIYRWFGREAKEVTLLLGFGLLFAGLARVDVTLALVIVGGLLVRLAWPTPLPPAPRESPHSQPSGSR